MAKKSKNMNKILIGAGLLALAGGGYYLYSQSNSNPAKDNFNKKYGNITLDVYDVSEATNYKNTLSMFDFIEILNDKSEQYDFVTKVGNIMEVTEANSGKFLTITIPVMQLSVIDKADAEYKNLIAQGKK